jgi:hypothetical protein
MNTFFKFLIITLLFSSSVYAEDKLSLVTLYNSQTTLSGGLSTIAIVRQESGRIKLLSCQRRYHGEFRDFTKARDFFNEGLNTSVKRRTNCISYQDSTLTYVNSIRRNDGKVARWTLTMPSSTPIMSGTFSDLTVWTIDSHFGIAGMPETDTALLTGVRVTHDRLNNPEMSTYKDTYIISGMAQVEFPEVE